MSIFKKDIITFGGSNDDLVWMYNASNTRDIAFVAEAPYEVVYKKNGEIIGVYRNQKIDHKKPVIGGKDSIDKYYFINVQMPSQTNWGTAQKLEYKDATSGRIISIGANGIIAFHISDSKKFMEKVLGSLDRYTADDFTRQMLPKVFDDFNEILLSVLEGGNIAYSRMDGMLKEIASGMLPKINAALDKYGVHVEEFIIKQLIKPDELKDRANMLVGKKEDFNDTILEKERELALLKMQEEIEKQKMQMELNKGDMHKINAQKAADIERIGLETKRMEAQLSADAEKAGYEAKGISYKEIRELDREDIAVAGEAAAKVAEASRDPEGTVVVIKQDNSGKCPFCESEITAGHIFCPTCKKKII
jgi:hypothetical protein